MLQYLRNFLFFFLVVLFCSFQFLIFKCIFTHDLWKDSRCLRLRTSHDLHWEDKTNKLRLPDTFDRWRILSKLWFLSHSKGLSVIFSVIFKRKKEKMEKMLAAKWLLRNSYHPEGEMKYSYMLYYYCIKKLWNRCHVTTKFIAECTTACPLLYAHSSTNLSRHFSGRPKRKTILQGTPTGCGDNGIVFKIKVRLRTFCTWWVTCRFKHSY